MANRNIISRQDPDNARDGDSGISFSSNYLSTPTRPSRLWIFMIGGSAAGIILPLSRFFISSVAEDVVVPIFIDSQCHSSQTSSAISDIAGYEDFCRLTCNKSRITQPFFFLEDSHESLFSLPVFRSIINHVSDGDKVFIAFSAHSTYSTVTATEIAKQCSEHIDASNIKYGVFLPYLTFSTNDAAFDVLSEIKNDQIEVDLKSNLKTLHEASDRKSSKFIIGLSEKTISKKSNYQKNPFNIVQLLMSYSIVADNHGEYLNYAVSSLHDYLTPEDLISDKTFRDNLITVDFSNLALEFLMEHDALPLQLMGDQELIKSIVSFSRTGSKMLLSLGDKTIHRSVRMLFRKKPKLNSQQLNEVFSYKSNFGMKPYSQKRLAQELMGNLDSRQIYNPNMAANALLESIDAFTRENFSHISEQYY